MSLTQKNTKPSPITIGAKEGKTISVVGDRYRILASGKETDHSFAVIDMSFPLVADPDHTLMQDFRNLSM